MQEIVSYTDYVRLIVISTIAITALLAFFLVLFVYFYNKRNREEEKRSSKLVAFIETLQGDNSRLINYYEELNNQQKDRIRDLESLLMILGHDLKSPLAGIIGLGVLAKNDPGNATYAELILKSARRLEQRLNELLQIIYNAEGVRVREKILFNELTDQIMFDLSGIPGFKEVGFKVNIDVTSFISDKILVATILQNLIENAIKYRNTGTERCKAEISIKSFSQGVSIIVADNGIGIEDNEQDKIFDLFYRGTEQSSGTGLGLYNVKTAVEKLGGQIEISSKVGKGTSFKIYLPSLA